MTNSTLQIYYLSAISAFRNGGGTVQPDYSRPLDEQLCPLASGSLSWQHYFLAQAVANWQNQQLLLMAAAEPQLITERPGHMPRKEKHQQPGGHHQQPYRISCFRTA